MSSRDWKLRIQDILASANSILRRVEAMTFEDFRNHSDVPKACLYDFVIIGEASRNVPTEVRSRYPAIPWQLMCDMRNILTHEYFQVDIELTWRTIHNNLPPIVPLLEALLAQENQSESQSRDRP